MSAEIVSLEDKLTTHWEEQKQTCMNGLDAADRNLARLALIYGGQMCFDYFRVDGEFNE